MARIGILTCSNATQDLGCSSSSCLADLRKRKGAFSKYPQDESLDLIGIISCPGCPTLTGPDKLLQRIRGLTEFRVDAVHFTYCIKALCPFRKMYEKALKEAYPDIAIVIGTHQERITEQKYRERIKKLFSSKKKTMVDLILNKE
ncbi:MAG TPA: CGGC domain-containing protein [Nitrospirae bacterium]|nr:CGGC domain-containing protein [Nitrospirota bacterium]